MANPRELAEKAFTLLQDALRDSESRVSELDAELKRQRQPKNRVEERVDVLAHRLEIVEAECQRWQREAGHLEELLENERAKIQQLKKKLEVAESGPDRLTKKEVNFWRQRAEQFDAETWEYKNRIASLKQELQARGEPFDEFPAAPPEPSPAVGTESTQIAALDAAHEAANSLRHQLAARESELAALQANVAQAQSQLELHDSVAAEQSELRLRHAELAAERDALAAERTALTAERDELSAELDRTRAALDEARQLASNAESAGERISETVRERDTRLVEVYAELERTRAEMAGREAKMQALSTEIAQLRHGEQERGAELEELRAIAQRHLDALQERATEAQHLHASIQTQSAELERLRTGNQQLQDELAMLRSRSDAADGEHRSQLEELREELARWDMRGAELQARLAELEKERAVLVQQQDDTREQMAGLETELKEEKECTANLSEIANERREALTRLEERVEEADERYEEAKWRLGKAQHFERLVRRRKGLVGALIAALRAKSKANSALKAGVDGLRTFKAASEVNQHKLLARIDKLNAELREAEAAVAKHQGATQVNENLQAAQARIALLEERLNSQVEVIQTLEEELKATKAMQHSRDDRASELEEVRSQLEAKNEAIARLEADADEQQRKFAKLRGRESETMRMKAVEEKDRSVIDALQREVAQLREALENKDLDAAASDPAQRDGAVARLSGTLKEQAAEIAKLRDSVAQWKRKYEFLSTEAPDAYQSVAEK
jgi:chromosome segregation ATPase